MNDTRDELDPGRRAVLRSLLVENARDDLAGRSPARHRVLGVSLAIGLVAAVAVGAVSIGVAGLPLWFDPAATSTETARPTPTGTPVPTPTPPPTTAAPTPTPTPTATPPAGAAPSVADFQAAVIAAGLDCSSWEPRSGEGAPGVADGGTCQASGVTYTVFATEADAARVLALNDASQERAAVLSGPTWIAGVDDVTGMREDLVALQAVFGGTLNWDPAAQVDTIAGYYTRMLWDLCVAEGQNHFPGAVAEDYRPEASDVTPEGWPEVLVGFDTPASPMPTGTIWICRFGGDPSAPTLDYSTAKDI